MKRFVFGPILLACACPLVLAADEILFIRGGSGSVGFFEGGSDEQAASITNFLTSSGNHRWGELAAALRAESFELTELSEDPEVSLVPTPVPLDTMDLSRYAVIVFGSNNAEYTTAQVDALVAYISNGGSALFISVAAKDPDGTVTPPIRLTDWHRVEIATAFQRAVKNTCITADQAELLWEDFTEDIEAGRFEIVIVDHARLIDRTLALTRKHTATTGSRSLDLIHIASAIEMGAPIF